MNENIENLRSIQTRLKEKSDQLETLQEDKKEISKEIVKMKETINNKIEVHTIVEDNSKILTVKIVELESSIAQISLDKKQLVEQIENDRELIQQQEESIKKLKEEKIRWKGKYELKEEEIWNIEQELASLHGLKSKVIECESLQKQLSEMKQKIQSQKRENDESKRNHIEATRQLEEKENEIKRLKEIDRQQQKNISDTETKMKSQYRSATSEREDLEKKLSVSADKLRSSERMIDQLKEQCGVYERELKRLQSPMKVSVNPNIISPFQF
ncbi:MAG: hypothetical protein EZS28_029745 [Streblomastix strix]|uniref:Uncharacterized protein n=1 Tax=Streblomastix strix TaxID=222440 RepID=A0A5J4UWA5_9EUKA|nr:MAG: hypothetical protein EZS28_029745 [Streblomastix strix]